MTLELNMFHVYKQPNVDMKEQEVSLIEENRDDSTISLCISKLLKMAHMTNTPFIEKFNLHYVNQLSK